MTTRSVWTLACVAALVAAGCATQLPQEEPLAVTPVRFGERELRAVDNIIVATDASGTMWNNKTFPEAKKLSRSFVKALPERSARSKSGQYNVGLIAFGGDDRVTVPLQPFNRNKLMAAAEQADIMGSIDGTGGMTPIHAVVDEIGTQLEGKSGRTAVLLFSDGLADDPDRAITAATQLSEIYPSPLCFHTVQVGDDPAGTDFMRQLAATSGCGSYQTAASFASPPPFERYAKNVLVGAAPLPPVAAAPAGCTGTIRLRGINFAFDKYNIDEISEVVLDEAISKVSACPNLSVHIDGFTDSIGTKEYNLGLSDRRAGSVKNFMVDRGVSSGRLTTQGHGMANPIASNETSAGRAKNRRVELTPRGN